MKSTSIASILFTCPQCNENFEFDAIGENEFVQCPICGANFVTIQKCSKLKLEAFEQALIC